MSDYDEGKDTSWAAGFGGYSSIANDPMSPHYSSYRSGQISRELIHGTGTNQRTDGATLSPTYSPSRGGGFGGGTGAIVCGALAIVSMFLIFVCVNLPAATPYDDTYAGLAIVGPLLLGLLIPCFLFMALGGLIEYLDKIVAETKQQATKVSGNS